MIALFSYLAKVDRTRYPALQQLIGGYFHEDYDLIGDTFNEIIQV
ncbi:contact-dependent growth inhibition system immunity protein [Cupriavidus sp. 2KB_3]